MKDLKLANKDLIDHTIDAIDTVNDATRSETSSNERGHASPVSDGKPAPEVVMVFGLLLGWPLAPGT